MARETNDVLNCHECKGVLLPERAVRLENGGDVLRYVCQDCHSRSYAVTIGSEVRVYPSKAIEYVSSAASELTL